MLGERTAWDLCLLVNMGAGFRRTSGCPSCGDAEPLGRRRFIGLLGLGLASILSGCTNELFHSEASANTGPQSLAKQMDSEIPPNEGLPAGSDLEGSGPPTIRTTPTTPPPSVPPTQTVQLDNIPAAQPGRPRTVAHGQSTSNQVAITIDDGYCADCVAAYVAFAESSGIHITFSPNGVYRDLWVPHAPTLRALVQSGQVQIGNHTYSHLDVTRLSAARVQTELERNEYWIQQTFGITARPWYRPPYGFHNSRTDDIAGELGFTQILMWNGSFGDAKLLTPQQLMSQATRYLRGGNIVLGHANHPTATHLFPQIEAIISQRGLVPVTLDEMFGTSRATG